jgi:NodT family efflux transporter outer membrane factor (OMF) lipoprotein
VSHAFSLTVLLAGRAVGPNFQPPPAPRSGAYAPGTLPETTASSPGLAGEAQHFDPSLEVRADWWKAFGSPELDALVERALTRSPTLEAADAALRAAQHNTLAQRGFFYPTVSAGYTPERTKLAGNQGGNSPGIQGDGSVISTYEGTPASEGGTAPFNAPVVYNFHTAQLSLSYAVDLFGVNRRLVENFQAQAALQGFQREAAYVTLASNLVAAVIQEALLRRQIELTQEAIADGERAEQLVARQMRAGYSARLDLVAQQSALAQSRQQLPPLQKQREQALNLLRALSGDGPDEALPPLPALSALQLPRDLPLSLPAQLVRQRPDVRAAEEQVHAASALVGLAVANRFPQFSIDATWGGTAGRFGQMFLAPGRFFSLAGSLTQPLFDGGTLRHRQAAAEEDLRQADALYRATVLTALQNVADTLQAIHANAHSLAAAAQAEDRATEATALTSRQLERGYLDRLAWINARQAQNQARQQLAQAQALRLGDTAALFQALGGGWWNR